MLERSLRRVRLWRAPDPERLGEAGFAVEKHARGTGTDRQSAVFARRAP